MEYNVRTYVIFMHNFSFFLENKDSFFLKNKEQRIIRLESMIEMRELMRKWVSHPDISSAYFNLNPIKSWEGLEVQGKFGVKCNDLQRNMGNLT